MVVENAGESCIYQSVKSALIPLHERLPTGATVAPLIISSDKTRLSQFCGDKSAWPVYLTIGNISKDTCHLASSHATVLIGYIPIGKFDCFSDKARQLTRYQLFHHCMDIILGSVAQAGKSGINMTCADGLVRWIWPILQCKTHLSGTSKIKISFLLLHTQSLSHRLLK
jgi:Plavaka transposase